MKFASTTPTKLSPPPGKAQLVVSVDGCRNLFLVVGRNAKTWQVRFRLHGKRGTLNLGRWPAISLGDARRAANAAMALVDSGTDPRGHSETVGQAWAVYWPQRAPMLTHPGHDASRWMRLIDPVIGSVPLAKLSKAHFAQLQTFWSANGNAGGGQHGLVRILRHWQDWALDRDLLDRAFIPRKPILPVVGSHSLPTTDEVRALLRWCEAQYAAPGGAQGFPDRNAQARACIIALLALTGARLEMIRGLRWSEIDGDVLVWPADRMKVKRDYRQPISPAARVWLDRIPPNNFAWCFPASKLGVDPGSGPTRVDVSAWVRKAGFPHPAHSLRKAFATWLGEAGYPDEVIGLALSHTPSGVLSVYAKSDRLEERRAALAAWGEAVTGQPRAAQSTNS